MYVSESEALFKRFELNLTSKTTNLEKKAIKELKEKLLGDHKKNLEHYSALLEESMRYIIPRFERTWLIKIYKHPCGDWVMTCSCPMFEIFGHSCHHMFSLLDCRPSPRDAIIRWHVDYTHNYGRDDAITSEYIHLRDMILLPGPVLTNDKVEAIYELI